MSSKAGNPPASPSRVERFYARHAPIYDLTRRWILPGRQRAIDALGVLHGDLVLDFACGTGLNVPGLRRAGAGRVVGVDLSAAMLERARRRFPDVEFHLGDLATIDLGIRAPRVLCSFGVSLVADEAAAIANLERHVAPGGRLVVLDFDRLSGRWGWLQPLYRAWLSRFGVRGSSVHHEAGWGAQYASAAARSLAGGYSVLLRIEPRLPAGDGGPPDPPPSGRISGPICRSSE